MIKYAVLAFVLYIAYRLFSGSPRLGGGRRRELDDQEPDDPDFVDYEEID